MRLLLDENIPTDLALCLRDAAHDVVAGWESMRDAMGCRRLRIREVPGPGASH